MTKKNRQTVVGTAINPIYQCVRRTDFPVNDSYESNNCCWPANRMYFDGVTYRQYYYPTYRNLRTKSNKTVPERRTKECSVIFIGKSKAFFFPVLSVSKTKKCVRIQIASTFETRLFHPGRRTYNNPTRVGFKTVLIFLDHDRVISMFILITRHCRFRLERRE